MHGGALSDELVAQIAAYIARRSAAAPLGRNDAPSAGGGSITAAGLGERAAWELFTRSVAPHNIGLDSERFLAFVPAAPSPAAVWMDAAVSASSFSAESWLEAPGAVAAENEVLRWLADLFGLPPQAGGCFVSGGSLANLSALAVARDLGGGRRAVLVGDSAHASVDNALKLLGLDAVVAPTDRCGRLTSAAARLAAEGRDDIAAICAAGGSTNAGAIDDLDGLAVLAGELRSWLHVDAAYGGAAMLLPERRTLFRGVERADSVTIDPHKWLFAPLGCGALLYRDPSKAVAVHRQAGPYLDILHGDDAEWNPSDYAFQLTRRANGLALWFALAVHGVDAYVEAVRAGVALAEAAAKRLAAVPGVELVMRPELSVVLFRRAGWAAPQWRAWADRLLADGVAFVAPTTWRGEPVGRLVFLHPATPIEVVDEVVASLSADTA
jgi:aromatic-L-amino-acid/L-tryptophan decarboxylase